MADSEDQKINFRTRYFRTYSLGKDEEFLRPYSYRLAANISHLRKVYRLSQLSLSEKADLPVPTISRIESGWANPTMCQLLKLSCFFNLSIQDLLSARLFKS